MGFCNSRDRCPALSLTTETLRAGGLLLSETDFCLELGTGSTCPQQAVKLHLATLLLRSHFSVAVEK